MTDDADDALPTPQLDATQARVLACLVEKEATTPEQYPLTANAVQVACNQKTARDPVLELDPGTVGHALRTLENERLVRSIHGSRAQRYDHRCDDVYAISPEQRVLLALLVLRGPQSAGELYARSERLHRFADVEAVRAVLERLCQRRPALARCLGRAAGQREDRYGHRLSGEPTPLSSVASSTSTGARDSGPDDALAARVAALEARVAELEQALSLRDGEGERRVDHHD